MASHAPPPAYMRAVADGSSPSAPLPIFSLLELERLLSHTESNPDAELDALGKRFADALHEVGFMYIEHHGVQEAVWEELINVTHPVMDAEPAELIGIKDDDCVPRGLTPLCGESVAAFAKAGDEPDFCQKWTTVSHENGVPNVWPSAEFRVAWTQYQQQIDITARRLLAIIGRVLQLDSIPEWGALMEGWRIYRHVRYPDTSIDRCTPEPTTDADAADDVRVRMHEHNDMDTITLLHQEPCPNGFCSLQARVNDQWVDVPAIRGTIVINFGEILSILTGGAVRATKHRVLAPPPSLRLGSSRSSTISFFQPLADFLVMPLIDQDLNRHFDANEKRPFGEWLRSAAKDIHKPRVPTTQPPVALANIAQAA